MNMPTLVGDIYILRNLRQNFPLGQLAEAPTVCGAPAADPLFFLSETVGKCWQLFYYRQRLPIFASFGC